jgi:triacylglycerol esterase/lipase EstA (alpha/beta hydrolase family)
VRRLVAATSLGLLAASAFAAPAARAALPVRYSAVDALAATILRPTGTPPPGANNWSCRPTAAHPRPVVLVHGTFANMTVNWNALSPLLVNNGFCVFALNYGAGRATRRRIYGIGPIASSAGELAAFIDRVRAATGAHRVDVVGHSQGGMMPRQYLRFGGGAAKVHALVGLAPSNHGTTLNGLARLAVFPGVPSAALGFFCRACRDQIAGSVFLRRLNAGGDTVPGVRYTVIATRRDRVVTPYRSAFLSGPRVRNITLQSGCRANRSEHLAVAFDRRALRHVLNALDPARARRPPCVVTLPGIGG